MFLSFCVWYVSWYLAARSRDEGEPQTNDAVWKCVTCYCAHSSPLVRSECRCTWMKLVPRKEIPLLLRNFRLLKSNFTFTCLFSFYWSVVRSCIGAVALLVSLLPISQNVHLFHRLKYEITFTKYCVWFVLRIQSSWKILENINNKNNPEMKKKNLIWKLKSNCIEKKNNLQDKYKKKP